MPFMFMSGSEVASSVANVVRLSSGFLLLFAASISFSAVLEDRVQGDFILPAYVNLDTATLVLQATPQLTNPVSLRVEFAACAGGQAPAGPVRITLKPGQHLENPVVIAKWPDGDYRVTITEDRGGEPAVAPLVRWLRKETLARSVPPSEPVSVGGMSTLFLDDWYVAKKSGLKACRGIAEGFGVVTHLLAPDSRQIGPTGGIELRPDGSFQVGIKDADTDNAINYYIARSPDGLKWSVTPNKPNEVTPYQAPSSPFWRPPGTPTKKVAKTKEGQFRYYEAEHDGTVALDQVDVVFTGAESQKKNKWGALTMPFRCAYPVWTKPDGESVILTREPLTTDNHKQVEGQPGDWRDTNDNWIRSPWRSPDGKTLYYGQSRLIRRYDPFRTLYDHQKDALMGNYNRIMVLWQTRDGLHWTPSFFDPQRETDPIGWQGYGGNQFYAEKGRLSLCVFYRYNARTQQMWPELLYCRDNQCWCRPPDSGPLVENGPWGSWNCGRMLGWYGMPVEKDGWVYQLFGIGDSRPHLYGTFVGYRRKAVTPDFLKGRFDPSIQEWPFWARLGSWEGFAADAQTHCRTVGGMRYRKDGWICLRPEGKAGFFETRLLRAASGLSLNGRTQPSGEIRVEVLDAASTPLKDYSGANAASFSGDSVDGSLRWKKGAIDWLPDQTLRLRVHLRDADLFALNWKP